MLIKKIELENFRQFYGTHSIELSTDPKRNVTLIHAENTFGKTTILNAVLWAFFEDVTGNFENPEKILNFDAKSEGMSTASVSIEFEFKGAQYSVKRSFDQNLRSHSRTKLFAYKIEKGNFNPIPAPETFIGSVVPQQMAKYFFFDGEAAAAYSAAKNHKAVGEAIRNILGCFLAERAIEDLNDLLKEVDRELAGDTDDAEIKEWEDQLSKGRESIEQFEVLKNSTKEAVSTYREQLRAIEDELRSMEGAKEIAASRDSKREQLKLLELDLQESEKNIINWISGEALNVVSEKLAAQSLDFIDEASLKGRIPSPYDEDFVASLLESLVCVCGRPLTAGTKEWESVASLLKTATNKEVLDRVVRSRALIKTLQKNRKSAPDKLIVEQRKVASKSALRDRLQGEIAEFGKKLEGIPIEEIAARERARRDLENQIDQKNREFGGAKAKITQLTEICDSLSLKIEKRAIHDIRAQKLIFRKKLLGQSQGVLRLTLAGYEKSARKEIEEQTNAILEIVSHNHRKCRFGDDFSIELVKEDGTPSPKSGGEKQLLSLVFISSLIKYAESRQNDGSILLKPGTVAPLVLDSPFGQLDPKYQVAAATYIPTLSPQVVLLVSGSQGNPEVLEAIESSVGKEYVLISEHKSPKGKKEETKLVRHGREIVTLHYSQKHDLTRIERVL